MKMVRQYANRNRLECTPLLNRHVDPSKSINVPYKNVARSIGERDSKEENAALDVCTTVSGHGAGV